MVTFKSSHLRRVWLLTDRAKEGSVSSPMMLLDPVPGEVELKQVVQLLEEPRQSQQVELQGRVQIPVEVQSAQP